VSQDDLSITEAYERTVGSEMPEDRELADYPDIEFAWDFDDPAEMQRRLPKLTAIRAAEI
jgi:hypothetical protein